MPDPHNLQRFVDAQQHVYDDVRAELGRGRKEGHWMWFIFPQIKGLGSSSMAQHYGIASLAEAKAYLAHPTLGVRLVECTGLVNAVPQRSATEILGSIDALKLRSSMTLFARASPEAAMFREALEKYFGGEEDKATIDRL